MPDNASTVIRRPRHLRTFVAVLAWLGQLLLPLAHAATMPADAAAQAWCGAGSVGLQASLAKLPAEIRQILTASSSKSGHLSNCVQCCAALGGHAAMGGAAPAAMALRETAPRPLGVLSAPAARLATTTSPPVRGPPYSCA